MAASNDATCHFDRRYFTSAATLNRSMTRASIPIPHPPHIMVPQNMPSHIGFAPIGGVHPSNGATFRRLPFGDAATVAGQTPSAQLEFSMRVTTNPSPSRSTLKRILFPGVKPMSMPGSVTRKIMIMDSM